MSPPFVIPDTQRLALAMVLAAVDADNDAFAGLIRWAEPRELAEAALYLSQWVAGAASDRAGFRGFLTAALRLGEDEAGAAAPHPWPSRPPPSSPNG